MESVLGENAVTKNSEKITNEREKTCPVLVRVFISRNRHHPLSEFSRGKTPDNEVQIHTWMDSTLKELTTQLRVLNPECRRRGNTFNIAVVYANLRQTGYSTRDIGTVTPGRPGADDNLTLASTRIQIGDFLDVAISQTRPMQGDGVGRGGLGGGGGGGPMAMLRNRGGRPY